MCQALIWAPRPMLFPDPLDPLTLVEADPKESNK